MFQTLYVSLLAVTSLAGLGVAVATWRNRSVAGSGSLVAMCLAAALWAGGTIGLTLASTPTVELRWLQFSYLGIIASPITYALVAVRYTGYVQSFPTRAAAILGGIGLMFLGLVWTNPYHHLYWADIDYTAAVPEGLTTIPGPGFWAFVVFTYGLLGAGSYLYLTYAVTAPDLYRRQTAALFIAVAAPWAANIPHALQLMAADLTPVAISVTVGALWVAMFRYRLAQVGPIALRTVFERISPAVVVLDPQHRIVDINPTGKELFDVSAEVIGTPIEDVVDEALLPSLRETVVDGEVVTVGETESDRRFYEVTVTPTGSGQQPQHGRVVVLNDITALKRQQRRLEAQNERLDEFTSVVSHDLRNPLNVAQGRLDLAREECDNDHLETVADAHERMDELIDDLLALARSGADVRTRHPVSVASVAEEAWTNIDAPGATLDVPIDRVIEADRSRLKQLFENLFRNSVEHSSTSSRTESGDSVEHSSTSSQRGARADDSVEHSRSRDGDAVSRDDENSQREFSNHSTGSRLEADDSIEHGGRDVTITVGELSDGFYIEDTGPGIPESDRSRIFETGYTSTDDGTGFGLGIVSRIVEAHGWEISVATGTEGGACFEITGVTVAE